MSKKINKPQLRQLQNIRESEFNNFDGATIASDLAVSHGVLWDAVIFDRPLGVDLLVSLRDLPHGIWNADTLFVLCSTMKQVKGLQAAAKSWRADSVRVLKGPEASEVLGSFPTDKYVVEMWWD